MLFREVNSTEDKLVVVNFSATWCGPYKMMKPFFSFFPKRGQRVGEFSEANKKKLEATMNELI
ncbi:unnamed protein product [Nyctereutes procyonoides]|uniref:(raccoon dog) hypothetical protein n=1 Tax=Nyctereutes procyonoides TaxID=34880 RepID=A0A811ZY72_NYCPR|nr:unnamed protein product [Nyctereutes procyonoides]